MKIMSKSTLEKYSQTVGERNEVDENLALALITERIFGQQVLDPNWTWKRYYINQIFTVFLLVYVTIGTADVLRTVSEIELIAEAYYTLMITCALVIKYLLFIGNRVTFKKLYLMTKTSLLDLIKEDSIQKSIDVVNRVKTVVHLLFGLVLFSVGAYLIKALWYYIIGKRITLSRTTSILMPMTSPYYEIGLILHTIYLFQAAFTILVIDMWFMILAFFYCVTNDSLKKFLEVEKKRTEESDSTYAERLNDSLRRFYIAHEKQMEYLNTLNDLYKWPAVVPLCKVLVGTCLILLLMTEKINWTFASNMLPTSGEIFVYNWFGDQIKTKAVELNMALLSFDWPSMKLKDKKKYHIIVCYMTKEFCIRTGFGNDLSLFTMSAVLKASYQAFAVLKSMQNQ